MNTVLSYRSNPNFPERYISPKSLHKYLQENLAEFAELIGYSMKGQPIYNIHLGNGPVKVLAWSQMHGNESNATHAFLDLWYSLEKKENDELFSKISLDFILMLNPDGSELWQRRNGFNIDINRDFLGRASEEMRVYYKFLSKTSYDYALNLHEQRTIFTTDGLHPATFSFLAPSESADREITENRKKSMAVINQVAQVLRQSIPNRLARYTDEFYPAAFGDNLMKQGLSNILFEGGHYEDDYERHTTRKYYTIGLYEALKAIGELKGSTEGWEGYLELPENKTTHFDIIYRNVKISDAHDSRVDIAVQYREELDENKEKLKFVPIVMEIGDLRFKKGWKEIDAAELKFVCKDGCPKLDAIQNFELIEVDRL